MILLNIVDIIGEILLIPEMTVQFDTSAYKSVGLLFLDISYLMPVMNNEERLHDEYGIRGSDVGPSWYSCFYLTWILIA